MDLRTAEEVGRVYLAIGRSLDMDVRELPVLRRTSEVAIAAYDRNRDKILYNPPAFAYLEHLAPRSPVALWVGALGHELGHAFELGRRVFVPHDPFSSLEERSADVMSGMALRAIGVGARGLNDYSSILASLSPC